MTQTQFDQWLTSQQGSLWLRIVTWVVTAWIWVFIVMFLGYMILAFLGELPTLPIHEPIPGIPGDTVVTTTQPGTQL